MHTIILLSLVLSSSYSHYGIHNMTKKELSWFGIRVKMSREVDIVWQLFTCNKYYTLDLCLAMTFPIS